MIDVSENVRISLRQADGEYYPLFRRGDPDTCNISLVPATAGQAEADIRFFHHPTDNSNPREIGTIRFPDLPAGSEDTELQLDASIGAVGIMSVTVRHPDSGRIERLEMEIPDEPETTGFSVRSGSGWRGSPFARVLGVFFIAIALALVILLTFLVTDWGKEEPVPPPVSFLLDDVSRERT